MEQNKIYNMTSHPLLLSTPMVLSYIAKRKFCTRRIPTCANSLVDGRRVSGKTWKDYEFDIANYVLKDGVFWFFSGSTQRWYKIMPVYQPGDKLWFRETWACEFGGGILYKASHRHVKPDGQWRPSIHMPKSACRLWADCGVVNCEHLSDITEEQAVKEGIQSCRWETTGTERYKDYKADASGYGHPDHDYPTVFNPVTSFGTLWESIHGEGSWVANPPVYAINFNPTRKP